ncbi:MAG TPA: hypothetical protein VIL46_10220 [Gemmataceae bacterium]
MRRAVFVLLGVLELGLAAGLVAFAGRVPGRDQVGRGFARFAEVSGGAERQVDALRTQVADLRRPELQRLAERLGPQTRAVTAILGRREVNFAAVEALNRSLGQAARGLEGWAETLDADQARSLGTALAATADYLEKDVIPAARKAAAGMEQAAAGLEKDARRLATLLEKAPPDLRAARQIHEGLVRFDEALGRVAPALKLERLETIREGFAGMESALTTTAGQVEKFAGYTYPVVQIDGFRPKVEQRPFWPAGREIAKGLRQAVTGLKAADAELAKLHQELPALRQSLDASRDVVAATRRAMGKSLEQQAEIEALLRDIPKRSAALADELPQLGNTFAGMLRRAEQLAAVAGSLRKVRDGLDASLAHWPQLRASLKQSAAVLRGAQAQFERLLAQREEYERAAAASTELAEHFADLLPLFTDQLDVRLGEQEYALAQLKQGLSEVNASLPAAEETASELFATLRWLLWLVAGLVGVHGGYVLFDAAARPGRAPEATPAADPSGS